MNFFAVTKYLGIFSLATCLLFIPSAVWALWFRELDMFKAFLASMAVVVLVSGVLLLVGRRADKRLLNRDALALVGLGWLLIAAYGGLPFLFSGELSVVDAYFESMSGFTTTGATVLHDIEALPKSLLFWRSFTHWLGGLGIILLLIIVLPFLGAGGKMLYRSEVPGVDKRSLRPRITDSAFILFKIYAALTIAMTALLLVAGMDFYESLCHTFGTLATGGFSTRNDSIAAFDSLFVEVVIIVFMIIAGTSFGLLYCVANREWRKVFSNGEWQLYLAILGGSTLFIAANLMGIQGARGPGEMQVEQVGGAFRMAVFQTVSIMTTTGYCTEDFNLWPLFSRALLVLLMFVGGCSGSTGGGLKVARILLLFKLAVGQLNRTFRPKHIQVIRVGDMLLDDAIQRSVMAYFVLHVFILGMSTLVLAGLGLPLLTAFTAVAATLNNIGPGLELVGAVENYAFIPDTGKTLLSLLMAMGRLELYAICVLFIPGFWRRD